MFQRIPPLKIFLFNLLLLAGLLIGIELYLRNAGSIPGLIVDTPPFSFQPDSVTLYPDYTADEDGIMKFSRQGREFVQRTIAKKNEKENKNYNVLRMLADDFIAFNQDTIVNVFRSFMQGIKTKEHPNQVEQAYLNYCQSPVNSDGFRSIEFVQYNTEKTKVLLLGDSHTYGAEAKNITSSFADQLTAMGYIVYNTGIVATDPAQYLAVAKKYIPKLNPDIVILNFCLNNDIVYFKRPVKPFQMTFYHTNLTNIMACPDGGEYLPTAQAAYKFVMNECYIPNQDDNLFNKLSARSVIATKLWMALRKVGILPISFYQNPLVRQRTFVNNSKTTVTDYYINNIAEICKSNKAKFILTGIPDGLDADKIPEKVPELFEDVAYHIPVLTSVDWAPGKVHMNNNGHTKYALFLQQLIEKVLKQQAGYTN